MTIYERLDDATRKALGAKEPVHRANKKDKRKYSERELKELMNTNIQTYKRVHGRVRGKVDYL